MHDTGYEILASAHRKLTELRGVNPVTSAGSDLADVVQEADAPNAVIRAKQIVEDAESTDDAQQAADLLEGVLSETPYDPNDPESYYPGN